MDLAWIDEHLPTARTGPLELFRDRPWSMVARVPTVAGPVYAKENRGDTRYEAALVQALARLAPDRVLTPIAVDVRRGWALLPDGGPIPREAGTGDPYQWERLLADHARLQRYLAPHVDELLALGVPDHRPSNFAANLGRLPASDALTAELPALAVAHRAPSAGPEDRCQHRTHARGHLHRRSDALRRHQPDATVRGPLRPRWSHRGRRSDAQRSRRPDPTRLRAHWRRLPGRSGHPHGRRTWAAVTGCARR